MCATDTPLGIALRTLGYSPRLLNALNGLVYFLIIGGPRGDNLMVGSLKKKLRKTGSGTLLRNNLSLHLSLYPVYVDIPW